MQSSENFVVIIVSTDKFGKKVVEAVNFDGKRNYKEDLKKSTLHIDHPPVAKYFQNTLLSY